MPWRALIDIVGFQSTWWACALGAAAGRWEPGVAVAAVVTIGQVAAASQRRALIGTIIASLMMAIAAETALVATGFVSYATASPAVALAPAWIVVLWIVFATCIPATDRMLGKNAVLWSVPLGAVIAPPTYWAGEGLGALTFSEPRLAALAATGVVWMVATPLMVLVYRRLREPGAASR